MSKQSPLDFKTEGTTLKEQDDEIIYNMEDN